jgi:ribosomal protein L6P/L9E
MFENLYVTCWKKSYRNSKDVSITINKDKITVKGKNGTLERTIVDIL